MHLLAIVAANRGGTAARKQNAPASVGRGFAFLAPDPRLSSKAGSLGRRQATWLPRGPLQAGPGIQLRDSAGLLPASLLAPALATATRPPPEGRGAPAPFVFDCGPQSSSREARGSRSRRADTGAAKASRRGWNSFRCSAEFGSQAGCNSNRKPVPSRAKD